MSAGFSPPGKPVLQPPLCSPEPLTPRRVLRILHQPEAAHAPGTETSRALLLGVGPTPVEHFQSLGRSGPAWGGGWGQGLQRRDPSENRTRSWSAESGHWSRGCWPPGVSFCHVLLEAHSLAPASCASVLTVPFPQRRALRRELREAALIGSYLISWGLQPSET